MMKEKTGRVTFMPLNRLKPKSPVFPNAPDAIPLIEKMRFENVYTKAFHQVFGKTCVCRDLATAAAYVRSHGLNTITLDGDKVDRKGALTGGYHDVRRSRMEAIKNVTTWKTKLESDQQRSKEIKDAIRQIDQEITRLYGRIQVAISQQNQAMTLREPLLAETLTVAQEQDRLKDRIAKQERDIADLETELLGLQAKLVGYQDELKTPLAVGLSDAEEQTLTKLSEEVERRKNSMIELTKAKNEVRCNIPLSVHCLIAPPHSWQAARAALRSSLTKAYDDDAKSCAQSWML
jgi:structural maintenance of chromosome 3 (chondroitin sulfate proteoglycan 6)